MGLRAFPRQFLKIGSCMFPNCCAWERNIQVDGGVAMVRGRDALSPAPVMATDLRASVSLGSGRPYGYWNKPN